MNIIETILATIPIPHLVKVRQSFERPLIRDVATELRLKLLGLPKLNILKPGSRIAIAVGSRGITNISLLVRTLVEFLKIQGFNPFIVPAMGSHGGATATGQERILAELGITETLIGAPVLATMDLVEVGVTSQGFPAYLDKYAYQADGIIIINRIKAHVGFHGPFESGLLKMLSIGLAKQQGASICHDLGFGQMAVQIQDLAKVVMARTNLLGAVGIVENAYHETCQIEVLTAERILEREPELLKEAKRLAAKLPFNDFEVLVIDEIGKDISGTGFDTNVVGRYHTPYASGGPEISRIVVLDLTEQSHGNGNGLGIADFTTKRVFKKFSFEATYPNSLTTTVPTSVKIPMVLASDRLAIQAAIKTSNLLNKEQVRLVRIKNTLKIDEIEVSANLSNKAQEDSNLEVLSAPYPLTFDATGNLF